LWGYLVGAVTWDTPDGQPPVMDGDPNGLMMWTGRVSTKLAGADGSGINTQDVPKHGWFGITFAARVDFTNGDRMDVRLSIPFFSVIDPSQPEVFFPQGGPRTKIDCMPSSPRDNPPPIFAEQSGEYQTYLPILSPLRTAVPQAMPLLYGYGSPLQFTGTGMTRRDMDLHHGNTGVLLASQTTNNVSLGVTLPSPFDPAILGPGVHKVAAIWQQDSGEGQVLDVPLPDGRVSHFVASPNEQVNALLVVGVTVGTGNPSQPSLTSVLPSSAFQGGSVPVTLVGTNFIDGMTTVAVSGGGITVSGVTVMSPTQIMASIKVDPMAAVGMRSVTVTTPNGTSGTQGFTVVSIVPDWITVASGPGWILQQRTSNPLQMEFCTGMNFSICTSLTVIPGM
jgi:hypothetical protein